MPDTWECPLLRAFVLGLQQGELGRGPVGSVHVCACALHELQQVPGVCWVRAGSLCLQAGHSKDLPASREPGEGAWAHRRQRAGKGSHSWELPPGRPQNLRVGLSES